ncbi:MAG: DUF5723 family protein, partial [Balneolales bacterium]
GLSINELDQFPNQVQPYFIPASLPQQTVATEEQLQKMFGNETRFFQTQKYELIPFSLSWINNESARSVAFRTRGLSSFEMNRNWFLTDNEVSSNAYTEEDEPFNRFLNEKYQVYHEFSIGFAREVTMFNRWQAGLNTLLIGFSPKAIFAGMYSDVRYQSNYTASNGMWENTRQLQARTSGDIDRYLFDLVFSDPAEQAYQNRFQKDSNLEINGYGIGLDAGLTYIIPLGDDLSLLSINRAPLRKSLRFSFAITDLGLVRYNNNPGAWSSQTDPRTYEHLPDHTSLYFGHPGELFQYLGEDVSEHSIYENIEKDDIYPFFVQLPTQLHLGTVFQYQWISSMLDLNYRFNPSGFEAKGWLYSAGTELRLLDFLPLRGSIQLSPDKLVSYGIGAALDLNFIYLSAAVRIMHPEDNEPGWYANTVSALGLQIRI